ncbi:MAG: hypothetical protein KQH79_08540 [Bacteroidetes bacterium]|nr:hypothetical protein [Bacteroidota bacterium]
MRKINFIIVVLFLFFIGSATGQNIKNKQFTLISYNLTVDKGFADEISSLEPFIETIKTYNDPGNEKLKAILVHIIYYTLKENLEKELEIEILPINTFMREVDYDDYGYPDANIRTALRKGDSRFYFKVDANLETLTKDKQDESPDLFENVEKPFTYPQLTLDITVYNNEGIIPVAKWTGITTPKYPLTINSYFLKGFDNTEMEILPPEDQQKDNLYLMLDRAIHNAIQDHYND